MTKMYTPLDLNFPFGKSFADSIMKRDFDMIGILGTFGADMKVRYPGSKLTRIAEKLSDVGPLLLQASWSITAHIVEDANKADHILNECLPIFDELFESFPKTNLDHDIIAYWVYHTKLRWEKMLHHYYEFLLRMRQTVAERKNDARVEFQWEMARLKYNLQNELKSKVDTCHFIINYMMILMKEKWKVFKMFKQYHYCLSVCQTILDGTTWTVEGVLTTQQYLHFAWVYYTGRLLDYSNQPAHERAPFDDTCIIFESGFDGPPPRFILPSEPIALQTELVMLRENFQILEEDLAYWGNMRICGNWMALDVLADVKKYAYEMSFE